MNPATKSHHSPFNGDKIVAHKGAYLPRGIAIPMNLLLKPIFLGQLLEKLCKAHIDGQTKEESENYTLSSNPNMV